MQCHFPISCEKNSALFEKEERSERSRTRSGSKTPTNDSNNNNNNNKNLSNNHNSKNNSSTSKKYWKFRKSLERLKDENNVSMSDRHRRYYGGGTGTGLYTAPTTSTGGGRYQKSSTTATALDRLRSHLSPVGSYYKPLIRGFGRRDAVDDRVDREKTPTASTSGGKMSAISRLENKYSDILDRVGARRRGHEEDRDKTLEPDENQNPLMRSATAHQLSRAKLTSSSFSGADRKERTPYRLGRNKTSRYIGQSNDSGYMTGTGGSGRLLDDNYPLDYSGSSRTAGSGRRAYDRYQEDHEALRAGGATGYPAGTSRYGYTGDLSGAGYRSRAGHDYYDDLDASNATRQRTYTRNKTNENLGGANPLDSLSTTTRTAREDRPLNSRNRFAHRRTQATAADQQLTTTSTSTASQQNDELTSEDLELLSDDRSSEDNAAILLLLREDSQYLEAKKFEERMRRRKELKERLKRVEELAAQARAKKTETSLATAETTTNTEVDGKSAAEAEKNAEPLSSSTTVAAKEPKKKSKSKKVTNSSDTDSDETSTSESSSDEESIKSDKGTANKTQTDIKQQQQQQTKSDNNNNTNDSSTSSSSTTTTTSITAPTTTTSSLLGSSGSSSSSTNKSLFLHSDRNNNDLSKYRPGNLMHSSSSGALAFGGISARLAETRKQARYQPSMSSRTAAALADYGSDRYQPQNSAASVASAASAYKPSSYLFDSYNAYGSRRPNATAASGSSTSSSSLYQRQQLDAYQQLKQQQQHEQYMLSKSATSSALLHRSRIPKTLSTFVR